MSLFDDFDDDIADQVANDDGRDDGRQAGFGLFEDTNGLDASTLQGLLPPRQMTDCLGHEAIEAMLLDRIESGRLPHALLFCGLQGIGKATTAYRLARYLLSRGTQQNSATDAITAPGLFGEPLSSPDPVRCDLGLRLDDRCFRQVAAGAHPDLIVVERLFDEKKGRFKETVEVDEARKIAPFMRRTAAMGGWRVAIIDDADTMNRNAQNAILKILEEPPSNALLILICHRLGMMTPTIRSRARVVNFSPPSFDNFAALVRRDYGALGMDDLRALHSITGGSIGQAVRIAGQGGLEAISRVMGVLHGWPSWEWSQIHLLADSLAAAGQEESLKNFQDIFLWVMSGIMQAKARNAPLPQVLENEATIGLYEHYSLHDLIEITGQLRRHFDTVQHASLDRRYAVLGAFSLFKEAA